MRVRLDMHTHTEHSYDCSTPLAAQAAAIRTAQLDVVCATDHDTIEGALRLRALADGFTVIVGEEISTRDGDLIALYIDTAVPPGLTAEETIAQVKEQGGLVCVPHPFSRTRGQRLRQDVLDRLWPQVDCLEVFNARERSPADNDRAARWAAERNIPPAVGSDAHEPGALGSAFILVEPFDGPDELVTALATGEIHGRLSRPRTPLERVFDRLAGRG